MGVDVNHGGGGGHDGGRNGSPSIVLERERTRGLLISNHRSPLAVDCDRRCLLFDLVQCELRDGFIETPLSASSVTISNHRVLIEIPNQSAKVFVFLVINSTPLKKTFRRPPHTESLSGSVSPYFWKRKIAK